MFRLPVHTEAVQSHLQTRFLPVSRHSLKFSSASTKSLTRRKLLASSGTQRQTPLRPEAAALLPAEERGA